jgi:hypothetical protein
VAASRERNRLRGFERSPRKEDQNPSKKRPFFPPPAKAIDAEGQRQRANPVPGPSGVRLNRPRPPLPPRPILPQRVLTFDPLEQARVQWNSRGNFVFII